MSGAQAETWLGVIVNLGAFGLMAWLVRHTFTRTIPRLAREFREELALQRTGFFGELKDQRSAFREELREERNVHATYMDKVSSSVRALSDDLKEVNRDL